MIVLAKEDMQEYGLTFEELDWHDRQSRESMKQLLRLACAQTGFCIRGHRMMIEAAPGSGGCLILVTLLDAGKERKTYRIKKPCGFYVYAFADVEDLLCAVERLYGEAQPTTGSRLVRVDRQYRLILRAPKGLSPAEQSLLGEYGQLVGRGKLAAAAAAEHGVILAAENAIARIGACLMHQEHRKAQ